MITPLDDYFAYEAARPRSGAEQQADDARAAAIAASISRAQAVLTGRARRVLPLFQRSAPPASDRSVADAH